MRTLVCAAVLALAACEAATSSSTANEVTDLNHLLPISFGEAYDRGGGTRVPVQVTNLTGRSHRYVHIECGFYRDGALVGTEQRIWSDVKPSDVLTGELLPETNRADRIDCRRRVG